MLLIHLRRLLLLLLLLLLPLWLLLLLPLLPHAMLQLLQPMPPLLSLLPLPLLSPCRRPRHRRWAMPDAIYAFVSTAPRWRRESKPE